MSWFPFLRDLHSWYVIHFSSFMWAFLHPPFFLFPRSVGDEAGAWLDLVSLVRQRRGGAYYEIIWRGRAACCTTARANAASHTTQAVPLLFPLTRTIRSRSTKGANVKIYFPFFNNRGPHHCDCGYHFVLGHPRLSRFCKGTFYGPMSLSLSFLSLR